MSGVTAWFGPGDWVDITCLMVILAFALLGAWRGASGHVGRVVGLLAAVYAGYRLYPPIVAWMARVPALQRHADLVAVMPYVVVVAGAFLIFLLLRAALSNAIRLVVEQPLDGILGVAVGVAEAALLLAFAFSVISLLPVSPLRDAIEGSRSCRLAGPLVGRFTQAPARAQEKPPATPGASATNPATPAAPAASRSRRAPPVPSTAPAAAPKSGKTEPRRHVAPRHRPGT